MHTIHPVAFFLSRANSRWIFFFISQVRAVGQISSQFSPVGTIVTQITSSASLVISPDDAIKQKNGFRPETKVEVKKQRTRMMQTQFTG
jgi:hypothetical protein